MNQKMKYIGLLAILPLVMVALSPELVDDAFAQKAEGSPSQISPKSYGSATSDVVRPKVYDIGEVPAGDLTSCLVASRNHG